MAGVREALARELEKRHARREVGELEAEIERLRTQNERLRSAMRRCLTCEYRIAALDPGHPADPAASSIPGINDQ